MNGCVRAAAPRFAIAAASASLTVAGQAYVVRAGPVPGRGDFNGVYWTLTLVGLLPTVIYVVGVRSAGLTLYYGLALLLPTASGWTIALSSDDPTAGFYVALAWVVTLVSSLAGAMHEADRGDAPEPRRRTH